MDAHIIVIINSEEYPSMPFGEVTNILDSFGRENIFAIRIIIQPRPRRYDHDNDLFVSPMKDVLIFSKEIFHSCGNIQSFSTLCFDAHIECVFEEQFFESMKRSLQRVSLCRSCLDGIIPAGLFKGCTSLKEIYLYNNAITHIPDGVLDDLINLEYFYASNNAVAWMDVGRVFQHTPRIKTIDVGGNLFDIGDMTFPPGGDVYENGVWHLRKIT